MVNNKPILIIVAILLVGGGIYWYMSSDNMVTNKEMEVEEMVTESETMDKSEEMKTAYLDVSPEDAKELIDTNEELIVIDVSPVYDDGHIPGAINYPVGDGSLDEAIPTLDSGKPYLVYCHSDEASILGAQKLIDADFMTVYRLEGNYSAWVDAGYKVETTTVAQ